jgi:DNA-binding CsgD family transcriptional regulator
LARETYERIGLGQPIPDNDLGLALLMQRGLVEPARTLEGPGYYSQVALEVVERKERHHAQERLTQVLADLQGLPRLLDELRKAGGGSFMDGNLTYLTTEPAINARIQAAATAAQRRLLTCQPGGARPPEVLQMSSARDQESLRRGVTLRTIYHKSAQANTPDGIATKEWVEGVIALGAHVRTAAFPMLRMIVADDVAFIADYVDTSPDEVRCWQVTHPAMSAFIGEVFELMWAFSTPWEVARRTAAAATVTTQSQRSILRGLSGGQSFASIARELNLSESSVKQQFAELRARLGDLLKEDRRTASRPVNTNQAIFWWATSDEQDLP